MKRIVLLLGVVLATALGNAQQQFVVQSTHALSTSYVALDEQRNLLVTYGYQDKTVKFWDEKSGLLYHTIDLENYNNDLEVNTHEGKTYLLTGNTIVVYDSNTFKEVWRYPLGRIYAMDFVDLPEFNALTFFAQDTNGKQALYALDEKTRKFNAGDIPVFPGEGGINHFKFNSSSTYLFIQTEFMEDYVYSFKTGEYYELKGDFLDIFENGDVIKAEYDQDNGKATYIRMNPITKAEVWRQTLPLEKVLQQLLPYRTDIAINSDETSLWVAPGINIFTELDAKTGAVKGNIEVKGEKISMLSRGDILYAQNAYDTPYAKYKRYSAKPLVTYGKNMLNPTQLALYRGSESIDLLFSSGYGNKTFSLLASPQTTKFTKYQTTYRDDYGNGQMVVDQGSNKVYAVTSNTDPIKVFERGKPDSFGDLIENYGEVSGFDYSPHTHLMAMLSKGGMRIINTEEGSEVFSKMIAGETPFFDHGVSIAPYNNLVAYVTNEIRGDEAWNDRLHYFDFVSRKEKWTKEGRYYAVFHLADGKQLVAANATKQQMEVIDTETGNVLRSFPLDFGSDILEGELSPSGEYVFFSGYNDTSYLYHIPTGKLVKTFTEEGSGYSNGIFVTDDIFAVNASSAMKFYNIKTMEELLRIYVFEDNNWIALTPDGLFEGSQDAWDKVAFVKDKKVIPLESVFDQFYTPRLVYKVLADQTFKSNITINSLSQPPTIALTYKEGSRNLYVDDDTAEKEINTQNQKGTISLKGTANGGNIAELRLYQNGKLVGNNTRNLLVEDDVAQDPNAKDYTVTLMEGANDFMAVAVNAQGTESRPEKVTVIYTPSQQSLIKPQGIQAHLLIVGINEYQNPKYNLNYAVADATGFQESLQNGLANITSKTHVYFVKNEEAIRDNILAKLNEIAAVANPQDIFVFYYAGHGVMSAGADQEFFLVPSDVIQLYGDDGALKQKGISASELKKIASGIAAQKQLYILDACQSAGALATLARGASEEKAIAQLARSTGTHWLTASGSEQFATEFDELGHGVFTYALLEALSGKADSGDKQVTVNELKAYLETRVPEISEKYKGNPQYPSSYGFGQDFPLSLHQ